MSTTESEIHVENTGSFFVFYPNTAGAAKWLQDVTGAEPWQWFGGGLAVEHRMAWDLAQGAVADGFTVD